MTLGTVAANALDLDKVPFLRFCELGNLMGPPTCHRMRPQTRIVMEK